MWHRAGNQFIQERIEVARQRSSLLRESVALMLLGVAAFLLVSLYSFDPNDPSFNHASVSKVRNWAGLVGANLSDGLFQAVGYAAFWLPAVLGMLGLRLFHHRPPDFYWDRILSLPLLIMATSMLCGFALPQEAWLALPAGPGGTLGKMGERYLAPAFGDYGSMLLLGVLVALFFMVLTRFSVLMVLGVIQGLGLWLAALVRQAVAGGNARLAQLAGRQQRREERQRLEERLPDHGAEPVVVQAAGPEESPPSPLTRLWQGVLERKPRAKPRPEERAAELPVEPVLDLGPLDLDGVEPRLVEDDPVSSDPVEVALPPSPPREGLTIVAPPRTKPPAPPKVHQEKLPFSPEELSQLETEAPLPPLTLLERPAPDQGLPDRASLEMKARILEKKLLDFKVECKVVEVQPGPVVTTFEMDPAPGLKASKVIGLSDDLARSISTVSVRVVGNIPGKSVIGVEVPNERRQTVFLRTILESEVMNRLESPLAVALGSDIHGAPVVADLAKMPHLLVAGTTGSGKSVAVNAMICSILFRSRPDRVRMLMVDPKMLELSVYDGIPHLLSPVVTDVRKAANLLKWAVGEMERRYQLMSEAGVRNLGGFNVKAREWEKSGEVPTRRVKTGFDPETGQPQWEDQPLPAEELPIILIVIDELADLMMTVGKEVEPAIGRLAQMARAAGIHMILATQRPSVDVITGVIKANFPTRLAFQVASRIDSRTILDAQGAEALLGMGDGLYQPPGTGTLRRIHAPYVADGEVHRLVEFLKQTGAPQYNATILDGAEGEGDEGEPGFGDEGGDGEYDELYDQAVAIVIRSRKVSTSMVQRHFKIGYNRAARLVERMEQDGLVSPANPSGKREVLVPNREAE